MTDKKKPAKPKKKPAKQKGDAGNQANGSKEAAPTMTASMATTEIWKMLLDGHNRADILSYFTVKYPDVDGPAVFDAALALFSDSAMTVSGVNGFCQAATKKLYRNLVSIGDYIGALRAIKQLHELAEKAPRGAQTGTHDDDADGDNEPVMADVLKLVR